MKNKESRRSLRWLVIGLLVSLTAAALFLSCYGIFKSKAEQAYENPLETSNNIEFLYRCNQVLYRALYNETARPELDYLDLYYSISEELLPYAPYGLNAEDGEYLYLEDSAGNPSPEETPEALDESPEDPEMPDNPADSVREDPPASEQYVEQQRENYLRTAELLQEKGGYFSALEGCFQNMGLIYDYLIRDTQTGRTITNAEDIQDLINGEGYAFLLSFQYDEEGNPSVGDRIVGEDSALIRRCAAELTRSLALPSDQGVLLGTTYGPGDFQGMEQYVVRHYLKNCQIFYGMKEGMLEQIDQGTLASELEIQLYSGYWGRMRHLYMYRSGIDSYYHLFLLVILLLAFTLPLVDKDRPWASFSICRVPLEILFFFSFLLLLMVGPVRTMFAGIISGEWENGVSSVLRTLGFSVGKLEQSVLCYGFNLAILTALFLAVWYIGICLRRIRETGILAYVREKSEIYHIFPFLKNKAYPFFKKKILDFYHSLEQIDLTKDVKKKLIKLVILNGIVLSFICVMWIGGFAAVIVYSLLLYWVLKKYISDIQRRYRILLEATNEIAQGNLNVSIRENLGVFEPFRPQIYRIQQGFKRAVEEEVKSQRMKTELITNVSHDLKTPLTAIITYVNLLKEEGITEEERKAYLDTLERKSLRLKVLIEDLFEVSKATSKSMQLNIMDVDLMNLVKQVALEMSDKLKESGLEMRMNLTEEKAVLRLDSQKTYRIFENLFVNIAKYSLLGTRVYVNGLISQGEVVVTLKNISREELHVAPEELTERFVRGDASRNTEGSGLGLAIAKSLTELQGGKFVLELEDDLFKVVVSFPLPGEPKKPSPPEEAKTAETTEEAEPVEGKNFFQKKKGSATKK